MLLYSCGICFMRKGNFRCEIAKTSRKFPDCDQKHMTWSWPKTNIISPNVFCTYVEIPPWSNIERRFVPMIKRSWSAPKKLCIRSVPPRPIHIQSTNVFAKHMIIECETEILVRFKWSSFDDCSVSFFCWRTGFDMDVET
jgi:hypothetical protein